MAKTGSYGNRWQRQAVSVAVAKALAGSGGRRLRWYLVILPHTYPNTGRHWIGKKGGGN